MSSLTYIGQTPAEGTGSPVIVLRHLRRLAAHGWKISIIGEHGQDTGACERAGWTVKHLPLRRSWWPPFRPEKPWSRSLRTYLLAREARKLLADTPPDALFGYLAAHADFSAEIAANLAKMTGTPLSLLVHDDAAAFATDAAEKARLRRRHSKLLRRAHRCWFVSPELATAYDVPEEKRQVLLPIPEGWDKPAVWQSTHSVQPRVYYAGFIWPPQYRLLAKIARTLDEVGGRLVLLSRETPELRAFVEKEPADALKPFPSNREALAHLTAQAAGLLVSYSETTPEMPWITTSYPSKFVEYSHLGLPAAVVAPAESSIGRWADRAAYPYFFAPDQLAALANWCLSLRTESSWLQLAQTAHRLSQNEFNPESIHHTLEAALLG